MCSRFLTSVRTDVQRNVTRSHRLRQLHYGFWDFKNGVCHAMKITMAESKRDNMLLCFVFCSQIVSVEATTSNSSNHVVRTMLLLRPQRPYGLLETGSPGLPPLLLHNHSRALFLKCCFTSTETVRTIRDGEPRTPASTFTQLLSAVQFSSMFFYVHRDRTDY